MKADDPEPTLQIDAFILRTLELNPEIDFDDIADQIFYAYGYYIDASDVQERVRIYFYGDGSGDHISLN